jgi:alpha-L-rhamnosidase
MDNIAYDDSDWLPVKKYDVGYERLVSQIGPSIKVMRELKPVSINCLDPDTYIIDMGQNMVGRALLKVSGITGTKVRLRFGEMLNKDGSLYTENLRTAAQTDIYILKGETAEYYEPSFTFHGFRYIELNGYPGIPDMDSVTGHVLHSALSEIALPQIIALLPRV